MFKHNLITTTVKKWFPIWILHFSSRTNDKSSLKYFYLIGCIKLLRVRLFLGGISNIFLYQNSTETFWKCIETIYVIQKVVRHVSGFNFKNFLKEKRVIISYFGPYISLHFNSKYKSLYNMSSSCNSIGSLWFSQIKSHKFNPHTFYIVIVFKIFKE